MHYIVAGAVLLLSLVTALASYALAPKLMEENASDPEETTEYSTALAAKNPGFFRSRTWKQWVLMGIASLLCAWAAWSMAAAQTEVLDLIAKTAAILLLLSAMVIDWQTHLIPNALVLAGFAVGAVLLVVEFFVAPQGFVGTLLARILGLICCVVIFYVMARLTKDGIGLGDVKLIGCLGWLLGLASVLFTVLFALLICSVVSIVLLLGKKKDKHYRIPFGPFLFFGYIILLLLSY